MKNKTKIQWYGDTLDAEGKAQAPTLSPDVEHHLEGLNRGEFYICDNAEDPAIFIRTNKDTIVAFRLTADVEALARLFLSKTRPDATQYLLRLLDGAHFGQYAAGLAGGKIDETGAAELLSLLLRGALTIGYDVLTGKGAATIGKDGAAELLKLILRGDLKSDNFATGALGAGYALLKKDANGDSYLEVDRMMVRKVATFVQLLIQKIRAVGGQIILSPASMSCSRVEEHDTFYRCYFENADGAKTIAQEFAAGDQARCQTFNVKEGVNENVTNTYYWRLVVAVGENYIDLSKTDCDAGSTTPQAGDDIVQLGNRTDTARQSAIVLSAYGNDAPYLKMYRGIDSYELDGREFVNFSRTDIMLIADRLRFSTGESVKDYIDGKTATAVTNVRTEFALGDSPDVAPSTGWSTDSPQWTTGKYVWQRTAVTTAKGTTYGNVACIQGAKGEQGIPGKDGAPGRDGADGRTSYFHIKYSAVANPTSASQMTETPSTYIGTYVDYTAADSTDPKAYTWARFQGIQGEKGDQGIPGTNGADGKTYYLHIAYATSADGSQGFSTTDAAGKTYIGTCTDTNAADPTDHTRYAWAKMKGDQGDKGDTGKGVKALEPQYYLSTSATQQTGGTWQTACPAWQPGRYIWTRTKVTWTDNSVTYTTPALAGDINGFGEDLAAYKETVAARFEATDESIIAAVESSKEYTTEQIDGLQIGGRNYFAFSRVRFWGMNDNKVGTFDKSINGFRFEIKAEQPEATILCRIHQTMIPEAGWYTCSMWIKATKACHIAIDISDADIRLGDYLLEPDTEYQYVESTQYVTAHYAGYSSYNGFMDFSAYSGSFPADTTVYVKDLKLERGEKATDWTPAPEDLQSGIDSVNSALTEFKQSTTSQLSVLEGEINAKVSQTTLTQTLSNYVTTTTLNQKVSEINQTMDGITSRVSKTETSISGLTTRVTSAESTIKQQANEIALRVTQSQVDTTVGNAIDGLEIGGRNYFGFNKGVNFSIMSNKNGTNAMDRSIRGVTMKTAQLLATGTIVGRIQTLNLPENGWYTFSAWMKATTAIRIKLDICDLGDKSFTLTTEYQYLTLSVNVNQYITEGGYKGFVDFTAEGDGVPAGTTIYAKDIKIEKGEKATDWTPAPEDYSTTEELTSSFTMTAGGISLLGKEISLTGKVTFAMLSADAQGTINGKVDSATIIEGGKIKTSMIDVDSLFAQEINANNGTIKNLNVVNATVSGQLEGVTGTFSALATTSGSIVVNDTKLEVGGANILQQGQTDDGDPLSFYGQNIVARGNLGFERLASIEFNLSYVTDVYAHIAPVLSYDDTATEKYPAYPDVRANLIILKGTGKYTLNVCTSNPGCVIFVLNDSSQEKYVSMTRNANHWVFRIPSYNFGIFCTSGARNYYGTRLVDDLQSLVAGSTQ